MHQPKTPRGIQIICGLLVLGVLGMIYQVLLQPSFILFAAFLIPLWLYMAIGMLKHQRLAWKIAIVVLSIWLCLSLLNAILLSSVDMSDIVEPAKARDVALRSGTRVVMLVPVLYYLLRKKTRQYFSISPQPQTDSEG